VSKPVRDRVRVCCGTGSRTLLLTFSQVGNANQQEWIAVPVPALVSAETFATFLQGLQTNSFKFLFYGGLSAPRLVVLVEVR
jgi:hypothetical protein